MESIAETATKVQTHRDPCADIVGTVWEFNVPAGFTSRTPLRRVVTACVATDEPSFRTITLTCCDDGEPITYPMHALKRAYIQVGRVSQGVRMVNLGYGPDVHRISDYDLHAAVLEARTL